MKRLLRQVASRERTKESIRAEIEKVLYKEQNRFHGFMLFALASIYRPCRHQQFFSTSSAKFHGLSRSGFHTQAQLGYMMKTSMYDNMNQKAITKANEIVKYN